MLQQLISSAGLLAAAAAEPAVNTPSLLGILVQQLLAVVIFSAIGIVVFALAMWIIVRISPFSVRTEIEEDQNTALAIIVGSVMIGISIIIAAAIHG